MGVLRAEMVLDGSTPYEVFVTILPTFLFSTASVLLSSLLGSVTQGNNFKLFLFDFLIIVVPSILTCTIYSQKVEIISFLCLVFVTILFFIDKLALLKNVQHQKYSRKASHTYFITNARSTINVLTVIAILAVDFKVFPRQFAKTTNFGYSLMDSGVGLFIYSNGIVAPETKSKRNPLWKTTKGSVILILLGIARLFFTTQFNYNVAEIEYGVHWNFFFTLAFTKIFTSLVLNFFKIRFILFNALMLILSHEIFLQAGLQNFVIHSRREENLISANKEGIVSLLGYVSLYLFSVYFGYILNKNKNKNSLKIIAIFFITAWTCFIFSQVCQHFYDISRRLANAAYCFWVLFIGIFMTGLYYVLQTVQESHFGTITSNYLFSPFIFEAVNFNGLAFFLIANVLTGLVNLSMQTWAQSDIISIIILISYMFINCLIICILYWKKIKLKL